MSSQAFAQDMLQKLMDGSDIFGSKPWLQEEKNIRKCIQIVMQLIETLHRQAKACNICGNAFMSLLFSKAESMIWLEHLWSTSTEALSTCSTSTKWSFSNKFWTIFLFINFFLGLVIYIQTASFHLFVMKFGRWANCHLFISLVMNIGSLSPGALQLLW